jgi:hypothetical protein
MNYLTSQPWVYELVHRPGPPWTVEAAGTRPNRRCAIGWLSVRTLRFLLHRGCFLEAVMQAERITHEEVLAALRASGAAEARGIAAVVLDTDGGLSVIAGADAGTDMTTLDNVRRLDHARA